MQFLKISSRFFYSCYHIYIEFSRRSRCCRWFRCSIRKKTSSISQCHGSFFYNNCWLPDWRCHLSKIQSLNNAIDTWNNVSQTCIIFKTFNVDFRYSLYIIQSKKKKNIAYLNNFNRKIIQRWLVSLNIFLSLKKEFFKDYLF